MLTLHISFFLLKIKGLSQCSFPFGCLSVFELDVVQNQFGCSLEGFGLKYLLPLPWFFVTNYICRSFATKTFKVNSCCNYCNWFAGKDQPFISPHEQVHALKVDT